MCKNLAMTIRGSRPGSAPHLVVVLALDGVVAFELGLSPLAYRRTYREADSP